MKRPLGPEFEPRGAGLRWKAAGVVAATLGGKSLAATIPRATAVLQPRDQAVFRELCFGTMSFGGDADFETSSEMFSRCLDVGINFFDCANVYVDGRSEEILGELMRGSRKGGVLPTGTPDNSERMGCLTR